MLSQQALDLIAAVFGDETLRLPPGLWRAAVEVQEWAVAEAKRREAPGESPKG